MSGYIKEKIFGKRGFTMMEVLTVVGIIAIVCAIAIPSFFYISRSLDFKQRNDYAKTVFLVTYFTSTRFIGQLKREYIENEFEKLVQGQTE